MREKRPCMFIEFKCLKQTCQSEEFLSTDIFRSASTCSFLSFCAVFCKIGLTEYFLAAHLDGRIE